MKSSHLAGPPMPTFHLDAGMISSVLTKDRHASHCYPLEVPANSTGMVRKFHEIAHVSVYVISSLSYP